jgi:hypothetical protein
VYTTKAYRTQQIKALGASALTWHLTGIKLKKLTYQTLKNKPTVYIMVTGGGSDLF